MCHDASHTSQQCLGANVSSSRELLSLACAGNQMFVNAFKSATWTATVTSYGCTSTSDLSQKLASINSGNVDAVLVIVSNDVPVTSTAVSNAKMLKDSGVYVFAHTLFSSNKKVMLQLGDSLASGPVSSFSFGGQMTEATGAAPVVAAAIVKGMPPPLMTHRTSLMT